MTELLTLNLTISPCRSDDRSDFIALERDPEVMRFLDGGRAADPEQTDRDETFLRPRGHEPHVWTARRTATKSFVGWFCLWPEGEASADLGYRLRRSEWGQGLASEGASALVNWGFRSAGYERIIASTMAVNRASRRVLEKIGFSHIRTVHLDWPDPIPGAEQGEAQYELARLRWLERPGEH